MLMFVQPGLHAHLPHHQVLLRPGHRHPRAARPRLLLRVRHGDLRRAEVVPALPPRPRGQPRAVRLRLRVPHLGADTDRLRQPR